MRHLSSLLAALYFGVTLAHAQAVLETRAGRYEVIGLDRWTLTMLQDSLSAHGESLTTHTCAAVLRRALGFADASVFIRGMGAPGGREKFTEIMVVEPQDSARVKFLPLPDDSVPIRSAWEDIAQLLRQNPNLLSFLIQHPEALYSPAPPDSLLRLSSDTERLRLIWARGFPDEVVDTAIWTLQHDRNLDNQLPALLILGTPTLGAQAQVALGETLRSPMSFVSLMAARLLKYRVRELRLSLPWERLAPSLHAVLDGTNLFALRYVMELLTDTPPDSAFGRRLLARGGRIILARLAASDASVRAGAYTFLRHMTGYDLPPDLQPWREALGLAAVP